ncbi:helix-turn-helix domain-containing protein [Flavobacterium branchiarum]|uniref:Helix-turn-helix domain-containing protein n=1 Tax=Flavobacterium branchiarum TaxID=1114870 RepID=A0ABV5FSB2_9FLAO|nr:helix-turn-helix domain-containing protein [Flavobacterium branchiarum]MDN3673511.1 helix-turn-helix domain-containing protein [Flavobacterium branchiarum]
MIEILNLDKKHYPTGFSAHQIKSQDNTLLNKSFRSSFYQMFWVRSGELTLNLDNNLIHLNKFECSFVGINQVFSVETSSSFEVLLVCFEEDFFCRTDIDRQFLESCIFFNSDQAVKYKLHNSLKKAIVQYHQSLLHLCRQPYNELMYHFSHNTVERLLLFTQKGLLDKSYSPIETFKKSEVNLARNFRKLVKENLKEMRFVKDYADKLNISIKTLNEVCNSIYGKSPKKIIIEEIVIESKRLLRYTDLSIKEVAFELLFIDPSNFIRFFTNATGMSPKQYRTEFEEKRVYIPKPKSTTNTTTNTTTKE